MVDLYVNQGKSTADIGILLGFSDVTVGKSLKRHGVKLRPLGWNNPESRRKNDGKTRNRRLYEKKLASGICYFCGQESIIGKATCVECLQKKRSDAVDRSERHLEVNTCRTCGDSKPSYV